MSRSIIVDGIGPFSFYCGPEDTMSRSRMRVQFHGLMINDWSVEDAEKVIHTLQAFVDEAEEKT